MDDAIPRPARAAARRLIVNADDFGRSESINRAVIRAHREGILTTASLMTNERAFAQAVELARENPALGVGLHLTLICGHSALPQERIPELVNPDLEFDANPTNGHLHLHLHPTVFRILMEDATQLGIRRLRLTFDPFWLNVRLTSGHWRYRAMHALIHHCLAASARPRLKRRCIRHTRAVFGLLQNARVDENYITKLLPRLPAGDSELYSHPSLDEFRNEFDALISPRLRAQIDTQRIQLIRYQDL